MAISLYGGKKECLKKFPNVEQYWGCLDKMFAVNFSPAEILGCIFTKLGRSNPYMVFNNCSNGDGPLHI